MKKLNALLLLALLSGMAGGQNTGDSSRGGGLAAVSEGGGLVKLFWFPVTGQWPAGGFRLLGRRRQSPRRPVGPRRRHRSPEFPLRGGPGRC